MLFGVVLYKKMNAIGYGIRLIEGLEKAYTRKWSFLGSFLFVFFVTYSVLTVLGLIPNDTASVAVGTATDTKTPLVTLETSPLVASTPVAHPRDLTGVSVPYGRTGIVNVSGDLPVAIEASAIGLSVSIANPSSVAIATLDAALLHGAVRYPTSATLDEDGNVILFGHSSYLPIVHNLAYKTFNGIQKLKEGDEVTVYSTKTAYVYQVERVVKESADSGAPLPLSVSGRILTLSTCDSFGQKSDRFVITARFVESRPRGA